MSKYVLKLMTDARMREVSGGEVKNYGTYNFKFSNPKPVVDGLFCQRIFGPLRDFTCGCNVRKKKSFTDDFKGTECAVCGVSYLPVTARANRFGYIDTKCYYVNPLVYGMVGSILGIGAKALKELSVGTTRVMLESHPYGTLLDGFGNAYKIIVDMDNGHISSINSLIMEFRKLGIDGEVTLASNHMAQAKIYSKAGFGLYDLFNTCVLVAPALNRDMRYISESRVGYGEVNALYTRIVREGLRVNAVLQESLGCEEGMEPTINQADAAEILSFESNIIQKLVNMLMIDGCNAGVITVPPIIESLKGKSGIIRGNLLGKRVDFSGRSVIASGPNLPVNVMGLPADMVYELCKPIIIRDLSVIIKNDKDFTMVESLKLAILEYQNMSPRAFRLMDKISKSISVLVNRAPSLHRYSAMTFGVKVHNGKHIQFPPLACSPFNADFDGDTVAVHLILTDNAREDGVLTDFTYNLMHSGAYNKPNATPSHEMAVGAYLLSTGE